jgi:hypothetical protein
MSCLVIRTGDFIPFGRTSWLVADINDCSYLPSTEVPVRRMARPLPNSVTPTSEPSALCSSCSCESFNVHRRLASTVRWEGKSESTLQRHLLLQRPPRAPRPEHQKHHLQHHTAQISHACDRTRSPWDQHSTTHTHPSTNRTAPLHNNHVAPPFVGKA